MTDRADSALPAMGRRDYGCFGAAIAVGALALVILTVSLQRSQIGLSTEMDFTSTYGPEAQRILAGEPLLLEYHPPGYPFMAALGKLLAGSWLAAGLWVSGVSALVVLLSSFFTFRRLAGSAAGWGALVACACSWTFLSFASMATSDMPFAALVCAALAFAVAGMGGRGHLSMWIATGCVAALAFLTRTNGIVMAALCAAPLFMSAGWRTRLQCSGATAAAFAVPVMAWVLYAHASHSPLSPTGNYLNLAVAAYGADGENFGEAAMALEDRFHNTAEVLAHDPVRMARQLGYRLLKLPFLLLLKMTWLPLALLAIPGLYFIVRQRRTAPLLFYAGVLLALTVLSALTPYRPRFFIFVIPPIGALAAYAVTQLTPRFKLGRMERVGVLAALLLVTGLVIRLAYFRVAPRLETPMQAEFVEAIPQVRRVTPPDALLYASSYTLSFETERDGELIPDVDTVTELHEQLCLEIEAEDRPYLYVGSMERQDRFRGALTSDLVKRTVPWLEKLAGGPKTDWSLYRVALSDCPG